MCKHVDTHRQNILLLSHKNAVLLFMLYYSLFVCGLFVPFAQQHLMEIPESTDTTLILFKGYLTFHRVDVHILFSHSLTDRY